MRLFSSTVCCLALAVGVASADVPASPRATPVPRPPTTTLATSVRVFPASAGTSHPARVQVKVPRATLQALLQRAQRDGDADPAQLAQVTPASDAGPSPTRAIRTVVAAVALALAVLLLPALRRRRPTAGLAVALLILTATWSAHADIAAPPGLRQRSPGGPSRVPAPATTLPTPATLELVVTDDGSSGILLTHATPR